MSLVVGGLEFSFRRSEIFVPAKHSLVRPDATWDTTHADVWWRVPQRGNALGLGSCGDPSPTAVAPLGGCLPLARGR